MEFKHISVLFGESIDALNIKPNGIYADGTLGGGGHSHGILSTNDSCRLIGIDQDKEAIAAAKERLKEFDGRVTFVNRNFSEIKDILSELDIDEIDGAVLDLGVSSYQLDNAERGFSYMHDAALDMRMNTSSPKSAYDVVNSYSCEELTRIFYDYGEEKWSKRIAEFICEKRKIKPVETTFELVEIIKAAIPKKVRMEGGHPAKKTFQAIRIEVNQELTVLKESLDTMIDHLNPGGRICVITFHSLEDRITKIKFRENENPCTCPPDFPVCVCGKVSKGKVITRKPIIPSEEEMTENKRSKSSKLRIFERR